MPNCTWFATTSDHLALLETIFEQGGIELFELQSPDNQPIRQLQSPGAALALFDTPHSNGDARLTLHLNIRVLAGSPKLECERIPRDNGTWFERTGPVGFVQFFLSREADAALDYSTTNTVTAARMGATNGIYTGLDGTHWDIGATNRYSSWLNRQIKKKGTAKLNAMPVHSGARDLWDDGATLWQFDKATKPEALVKP